MPNRDFAWVTGQLIHASDRVQENETALDFAGLLAAYCVGATSMQPLLNPLLVTVDLSNHVTVGGSGQQCILTGRHCTEITALTTAVPVNTNPSLPRHDIIVGQAAETLVNPQVVPVKQPDGTIVNTTVYQYAQNAAFQYLQGTTGSPPSIPSGFALVASIAVPPASGNITAGNITINLLTIS